VNDVPIDSAHQRWPWLRLLRPAQWVKNAFVLAPLLLTPKSLTLANAAHVGAGALCFCAVASAVYIVNDATDREADRLHPLKRRRPLAANQLSVAAALALAALLALAGLGAGAWLSPPFAMVLGGYLALSGAYSLGLKNIAILDVMIIAIGFVLRVEAGGILADIKLSVWLKLCSGLLALFLAIAKRRDDVIRKLGHDHRASLGGYNRRFLDTAMTLVLGSLLVSYTTYTADATVIARLGCENLYITVPFVLAGCLRYLQITVVEERSGAPTEIVRSDRFLILTILGWIATFGGLIYW